MVGLSDTINGRRNTLSLEQAGLLTRAKEIGCLLALSDAIEVTHDTLVKVGRGKAFARRREFEETLRSIASQRQAYIVQMIKLTKKVQNLRVAFGDALLDIALEQEFHNWCVRSTSS